MLWAWAANRVHAFPTDPTGFAEAGARSICGWVGTDTEPDQDPEPVTDDDRCRKCVVAVQLGRTAFTGTWVPDV